MYVTATLHIAHDKGAVIERSNISSHTETTLLPALAYYLTECKESITLSTTHIDVLCCSSITVQYVCD
jgi:hypothetical protein